MSAAAWEAFADDAATLARLHDRELDTATIAALREVGFPGNLALLPQTAEAQDAWKTMGAALDYYIPASPAPADLDALAVEYAAIYLTGAYGASPTESVWLDQDHIACQQPMFDLREIYQAAGLRRGRLAQAARRPSGAAVAVRRPHGSPWRQRRLFR